MIDAYSFGKMTINGIDRFRQALVIDIEAVPNGEMFHIGAVLNGRIFERKSITDPRAALTQLSKFSSKARYVLGHNIRYHDLALVKKVWPKAPLLQLPVIDTLYLSPLAFPENPYHRLVKDYKLVKHSKNSPVSDARLAANVFQDQVAALSQLYRDVPELIQFYAFAFEPAGPGNGTIPLTGVFDLFCTFCQSVPDADRAKAIFLEICQENICARAFETVWKTCHQDPEQRPMLAYALSWLRVSGGNSIVPPWVKHRFPKLSDILIKLRFACGSRSCAFCRKNNDSEALLKTYFGFDHYRRLPDGRVLQKEIIETSMAGHSLLGILPTGGGKSICYQVPALHRYHRTGDLTVVISPLKALMKDQVDNLNRATGTETAGAVNGSLTLPERGAVMEKVRLGDIGILYISPEQLRNFSVAQLIRSRDVGCWVFDEAHCLSKWGHDFRPDYLNVADFIRDHSRSTGRTPLICAFTATAKKDVVEEICAHFDQILDLKLMQFVSGVQRDNLSFQVWPVTKNEKQDVIFNCLKDGLSEGGGAIVYCASRKNTEQLSEFLTEKGMRALAFHAGRTEPDKRNIQDDFVAGNIPVICATNAFGMGIDKKDIRLVIHSDIPGSLENYLQEAGRAGRDTGPADCILLYEQEDLDNQFSLNARSKLSLKDMKKILTVLKKRGARTPEIVITPGEILRLAGFSDFADNDTRARVGVSWLERKGFLTRSFNQTLFFKGRPLVQDMAEAEQKIAALNLSQMTAAVYRNILRTLFNADKNALLSADSLCAGLGEIENLPEAYLDSRHVMGLLSQMAQAGLIKEGVIMTAFVRPKGAGSSLRQLQTFVDIETRMLDLMAELSPEAWLSPDTPDIIHLRLMSQGLKDQGFDQVTPDTVDRLLYVMAKDKGENQGKSIKIAGRKGAEQKLIYVKFSWQKIRKRMTLRHQCARCCLEAIIAALPPHLRQGQAQVLSEFFLSRLIQAMRSDLFLSGYEGDPEALIECSLLFMHDMKVITLQNGLGVFRQAMTLILVPETRKRQYTRGDYEPLSHHYAQKNVQVHVMEKYARLGLEKIRSALAFVSDYFASSYDQFIRQYFPGEEKIIQTAMTAESFRQIVQSLENPVQEAIVATPPDKNILVLAGPGSGKTRTIVHRCAWLIKAQSVDPSAILVLCFNHQAMIELRKRIRVLTGTRGGAVTAMTFHGFAMRLTGHSFMETRTSRTSNKKPICFDDIIDTAIDILTGVREIAGVDPSESREYLLAPYRYILVDEYQDIDERQYRLISALTGRLEQDREAGIAIMAVGDDDQSIYGFRDANVKFIRKFQQDYAARTFCLTENYRCAHAVIQVSNALIARNTDRMKTGQPGRVDARRKHLAQDAGTSDPHGFVQVIQAHDIASQAVFTAQKIKQLVTDHPDIRYQDVAVVSRQGLKYPFLVALRMALAGEEIPFCYSIRHSAGFPLFRIREIQVCLKYLEDHKTESVTPGALRQTIFALFPQKNTWTDLIDQIFDSWCGINADREISLEQARAFVLETLVEEKRGHRIGTGVFLGTAHGVKGMEFPFVFILDGGWLSSNMEEERRLYYVAMTRAIRGLYLFQIQNSGNPHLPFLAPHPFAHVSSIEPAGINGFHDQLTVSTLGMEHLYLSFAGRFLQDHVIHSALARLSPMDRVFLKEKNRHIHIETDQHQTVARLSQKGKDLWQGRIHTIVHARVLGMIKRFNTDGQDKDHTPEPVDSWEIPIVEILHSRPADNLRY